MWDPHDLRNRKCECLTKLVKETQDLLVHPYEKRESKVQSLAMVFVQKLCVHSKEWDCPLSSSPCP